MSQRTALKLAPGESASLECLFNTPLEGASKFGDEKQWIYAVKDTKSLAEHSLYTNEKLHTILQGFGIKKGSRFILAKKSELSERGQPFSYFEVTVGGKSMNTMNPTAMMNGRPSPDFGEVNETTYRTNAATQERIEDFSDIDIPKPDPGTDRMFEIWREVCRKNDALPPEWKMGNAELQKMAVTLFLKG